MVAWRGDEVEDLEMEGKGDDDRQTSRVTEKFNPGFRERGRSLPSRLLLSRED